MAREIRGLKTGNLSFALPINQVGDLGQVISPLCAAFIIYKISGLNFTTKIPSSFKIWRNNFMEGKYNVFCKPFL